MQRLLEQEQLREFAHDGFVERQVQDFTDICEVRDGLVTDVGGGCGIFASALARKLPDVKLHVIDLDGNAVASCREAGIQADQVDLLRYMPKPDERVACFNLVLHHLVGTTLDQTRRLQLAALRGWRRSGTVLFVNEYAYDSWLGDMGARLMYSALSSPRLAKTCRWIATKVPSLKANSLGVGVRFRSRSSWVRLFREAGFETVGYARGDDEKIRRPLGLLFRSIRRDSFVLKGLPPRMGR